MKQIYGVAGMTCGGCARAVERAIKRNDATLEVTVDLPHGRVTVGGAIAAAAVEAAVTEAGFGFEGAVGA